LLQRLRGSAEARPAVDANLAGGLRAWLEDEVAELVTGLGEDAGPMVVDARRLTGDARGDLEPEPVTAPMALGALVATLFRQVVTTGHLDDPLDHALAGLEVDDHWDRVTEYLRDLPAPALTELAGDLDAAAARIAHDWGAIPAWWLPRTDDTVTVPLAGGRIVLTGIFDLVLGAPSAGAASVCLVEVRSGARRAGDRIRRRHHAFLETLRSGAPPFRVATYYTRDGSLEVDEVDDHMLNGTVDPVVRAIAEACSAPRPEGVTE
jgi:hypothetical protein